VADGVDVERCALQAELVEEGHQHFDDFGVDGGSVGAAEYFRALFGRTAVAALLRALAANMGPVVVELHGLGQRLHPVLKIRAADAGGGFRTEREHFLQLYILREENAFKKQRSILFPYRIASLRKTVSIVETPVANSLNL